jgi:large subunit ribosomal protein L15
MKVPIRGFNNGMFRRKLNTLNFWEIEKFYADGEAVTIETLRHKGLLKGNTWGVKLLADGELTKKVTIEVDAMSAAAKEKLDALGISYTIVAPQAQEAAE